MSKKHSPGPWYYDKQSMSGALIFSRIRRIVCEIKRQAVAGNRAHAERSIHDARLIAAAPELLEALIECMADASEYEAREGVKLVGGWPAKARAAIAKAEGAA